MAEGQRQLAAIVFTDIAGFTELSSRDENAALALVARQRELFQPKVAEYGGQWLKEMGDGLLLSFSSSLHAVQCAVWLQHLAGEVDGLNLRIGIHTGDVVLAEGDIFGDGVNIASRIEPLAPVGGIALSKKVELDLTSHPEFTTTSLGAMEFKGVNEPVEVLVLTSQGLPGPDAAALAGAKLAAAQSGPDVFISYSKENKESAEVICQFLEASGRRCWISPRDIVPGQEWAESITNALRESKLMLLVFSGQSNQSQQVVREVELAVKIEKILLPVRIEDVEPSGSMEYFLASSHWLDAYHQPLPEHMPELDAAIGHVIGKAAAQPAPERAPSAPKPAKNKKNLIMIAAALAVGVIAGGILLAKLVVDNDAPEEIPKQVNNEGNATPPIKGTNPQPPAPKQTNALPAGPLKIPVLLTTPLHSMVGHNNEVRSVAYAPEGTWVVSGSKDGSVRMWDVEKGEQIGPALIGHTDEINCVRISHNSTKIVSGADDNLVVLWNVEDRKILNTIPTSSAVWGVGFAADNRHVAAGTANNTIEYWEIGKTEPLKRFRGHRDIVNVVDIESMGRWVVSGADDATVRVWDPASGDTLKTLTDHRDTVWGAAFSLNGKFLATGSDDKKVMLYSTEDFSTMHELRGHTSGVNWVSFSRDNKLLVSAGEDRQVIIWRVADGEKLAELKHQAYLWSAEFSPDSRRLVTGGYDSNVYIWELPAGLATATKAEE